MQKKKKVIIPAFALIGTFLLFRFVLFIGYVPTESMEPTLKKGSIVVGSRLFGEPEVDNVIVFRHDGKLQVKRVAAMEGDLIYYKGKQIMVPTESLYLLGDNLCNSWDSRYWDDPFICNNDIIALVLNSIP